jgi:hypothetical protein
MVRSPISGIGFELRPARVAPSLTKAVAASLAVASLSLCLIVTLTLLSIRVAIAG